MQRKNVSIKACLFAGVSACVVASVFASSASAKTYTVVNAGFEDTSAANGDVQGAAGWATYQGDGAYTTAGQHRSGTQAGKTFGDPGLFQQTIAATDPVGTTYTASVYAGNIAGDALSGPNGGFINIDFLSSTGTVLASVTGGEEGSSLTSADPKGYKLIQVVAPSVAGTASVRIDLVSGPYTGLAGTNGGAIFFDDVSLTTPTATTPEPASLAAVGLTGTGLLARRRRTPSA